MLFQIVAPTPLSLMLDKKMNLPVVRLKEVNRAGCRIVPFIFFLYRQVHPFSDGWLKMTWNVTVSFVLLA